VTVAQVAAITPHLPPTLEKIGVFVDGAPDEIFSTVRACGLTGVQLHFGDIPDLPAELHRQFGRDLRILRVVHFEPGATENAKRAAADPDIDGILVDSRTATAVGGTGLTFNWTDARKVLFESVEQRKPLIAAGGLSPENVREAIATLRPWGVDVVSGVEATPGRKDAEKVRAFIGAARNRG
jgi:phosphoribosylanthranilate isomerase